MDELLGRAWWMLILRGTVALLFGTLALFWPGLTLLLLITLFSAYAIASGLVAIVAAVRYRVHVGVSVNPRCRLFGFPVRQGRHR